MRERTLTYDNSYPFHLPLKELFELYDFVEVASHFFRTDYNRKGDFVLRVVPWWEEPSKDKKWEVVHITDDPNNQIPPLYDATFKEAFEYYNHHWVENFSYENNDGF
jgi:hypothetical protein